MAKRVLNDEVNTDDAAKILGMSRRCVLYAHAAGHLVGRKDSGLLWKFTRKSVLAYKQQRDAESTRTKLRSRKPGNPRRQQAAKQRKKASRRLSK